MKKHLKELSNLKKELNSLTIDIDRIKYFEKDPYISKNASWMARQNRLSLEALKAEKEKRCQQLEFIKKLTDLLDKEA